MAGDDWQPEIDELRRREAARAARWAARTRSSASTTSASSRCASASTRSSTPARSTRSARSPASRSLRGRRQLVDFQPANFVMGRAALDGRPGRRRRRRLHRARRGVRRVDRRQAGDGRAAGQRVRRPDRPARRRHRRRRLDQVARGRRATPTSRPTRAGSGSSPTWPRCPVVALALGSVAGLGAARVVASHYSLMVTRHSQIFVAGPPVVAPPRRDGHQGGARRRPTSTATTARSATSCDASTRRSSAPASSCPTCRRRSTSWPSAPRPTTTRSARDDWLIGAIPRNRRQGYAHPPDHRGRRRRRVVLRDRRGCGAARRVTGLARLDGWPVAVLSSGPDVLRRRA